MDLTTEASREWITIARVIKTQGRRGELAAELHTDFLRRFEGLERVFLVQEGRPPRPFPLQHHWFHKGWVILQLEGIAGLEDAEPWVGAEVRLPAAERMAPPAGGYFIADLVGREVFHDGRRLGQLQEVRPLPGAGWLLQIVTAEGGELLVPFAAEYVVAVVEGRVDLHLPDGLAEINAPHGVKIEAPRGAGGLEREVMRFDLLTLFPEFFRGPLDHGVVARAARLGGMAIAVHDLREFAADAHRTADDRPFGGGEGMVMKPEPIYACLERCLGAAPAASRAAGAAARVVLLSPRGVAFTQAAARRLAAYPRLVLICGRYEGVDERVAAFLADEELSVGDYVLSGGELAALIVLDTVARLVPGVLGDEQSAVNESFAAGGILDYPQYTRPWEFHGWSVPEVLRSGNHAAIARWRRREALRKTWLHRPDLLVGADLSAEDRRWLEELRQSPPT